MIRRFCPIFAMLAFVCQAGCGSDGTDGEPDIVGVDVFFDSANPGHDAAEHDASDGEEPPRSDAADADDGGSVDAWPDDGNVAQEAVLNVIIDDYKGVRNGLTEARVLLYRKTAENRYDCLDLDARNLPSNVAVSREGVSIHGPVARFQELSGLAEDLEQEYTVVALVEDGSDEPELLAWACNDRDAMVEYGAKVTVPLTLFDVAPSIVGSWDVSSSMDFSRLLHPVARDVLDIVIDIMLRPSSSILMLMCDPSIAGIGGNEEFCAAIFSDPDNPDPAAFTTSGQIAAQIIDSNHSSMLASACPYEEPALCEQVYFTVNELLSPLDEVRVLSTMTCLGDPVSPYEIGDLMRAFGAQDCQENWHSVVFRWPLGHDCDPSDPECGAAYFSLGSIPGIQTNLSCGISGSLGDGWHLNIEKHLVGLKPGALISFGLLSFILPSLLGDGSDGLPAVNTVEKLIGSMLGGRACLTDSSCCDDFDSALDVGGAVMPVDSARAACESLIEQFSGLFVQHFHDLDTGGGIMIATSAEGALLVDANGDQAFDLIGAREAPAAWLLEATVGQMSYEGSGSFFGVEN